MGRRRIKDFFIITEHHPYEPYDRSLDTCMYIGGILGLIGIISVVLIKYLIGIDLLNLAPPCILHTITGYYCPGCGGTRALIYFLQGCIIKSFIYHPVVPYVGIPGIWLIISHTLYHFQKKHNSFIRPLTIKPAYIYVGIIILFLQCVIKNMLLLLCNYRVI